MVLGALHPQAALTLLPLSRMSGWLQHDVHKGKKKEKKEVKHWGLLMVDNEDLPADTAIFTIHLYVKKNSSEPDVSLTNVRLQPTRESSSFQVVSGTATYTFRTEVTADAQMWIKAFSLTQPSAHPTISITEPSTDGQLTRVRSLTSTGVVSTTAVTPRSIVPLVSLDVQVMETRNVKFQNFPIGSNSFVLLKLLQFEQRTTTLWNTAEPTWMENFTFEFADVGAIESTDLLLYLTQQRTYGADIQCGTATVPLNTLLDKEAHCEWYPLIGTGKDSVVTGTVQLELHYAPPVSIDGVSVPGLLHVNVISGSGLAARDRNGLSDPFVVLRFGGEKKKTKAKRNTLAPFWDQSFSFRVHLPQVNDLLRITVYDRDLLSAPDFMGQTTIALSEIPIKQSFLSSFILYPRAVDTAQSTFSGAQSQTPAIRVKLHLNVIYVFPESRYTEFTQLLFSDPDMKLLTFVDFHSQRKEPLALNLVKMFYANNMLFRLTSYLIESEIRSTSDPEILFRGNSLTTKVVDALQKLFGGRFLSATLGPIIDKIAQLKKPVELDPMRITKDTAKNSLETIITLCQEMLDAIFASSDLLPSALNRTYSLLSSEIDAKFASNFSSTDLRRFRSIAISSFFFLRLICPALLSPVLFGLSGQVQNEITSRTLTLLAKTMQNLANFVAFGKKEPHMEPLNVFIENNYERMHLLLDHIATPSVHLVSPRSSASSDIVRPPSPLFAASSSTSASSSSSTTRPPSPSSDTLSTSPSSSLTLTAPQPLKSEPPVVPPLPSLALLGQSPSVDQVSAQRKQSLRTITHSSSLVTADPKLSFSYERELAIFHSFCREARLRSSTESGPQFSDEFIAELDRVLEDITVQKE